MTKTNVDDANDESEYDESAFIGIKRIFFNMISCQTLGVTRFSHAII